MFTSITLRPQALHLSRILFTALLLFAPLTLASAQGVGAGRDIADTGGNNVITGRIYYPNKPSEDVRIRVMLESNSSPTITTTTNADGVFKFSGVNTGYYTVVVDAGADYEIVREQVNIEKSMNYSSGSAQVPIYLRPKGSGPAAKPGAMNPALTGVPKAAIDLYQKGLEFAQKNDNKKAVEQFSKAVELHPQFALALYELGVQYLKLSQPDKAAEALQSATKIMPEEFMPRLNYGIALLNEKKYAEAETELRQALKKNNDSPTGHMYLGIALLTTSRDEKTRQYDMEKYAEAQKELETAVSTGKDEVAMAHRYLGGIYSGNKDYKRAADEIETYLKLSPKAPDAERLREVVKDLRKKG
jgi:tetratricopeptide (TPR) repeat protein